MKRRVNSIVLSLILAVSMSLVGTAEETEYDYNEELVLGESLLEEVPNEEEAGSEIFIDGVEGDDTEDQVIVDESVEEDSNVSQEVSSEPSEDFNDVEEQIALFDESDDDDWEDESEDESEDETEEPHEPQEIKSVTIRTDERVMAYREPAYDTVVQSGNVAIDYEKWVCVEDGTINGSSSSAYGMDDDEFEKFEVGKSYSYSIRIQAKDGDWFSENTVFEIGDRIITNGVFNRKKTMWVADNIFTKTAKCSHDYSRITEQPTCTNMGLVYDRCKYCQDTTIVRSIPAKGHAWEEDEDQRKDATCTEKGVRVYICENEGCGNVRYDYTNALGHKFVLDKEEGEVPTCTEAGFSHYACKNEDCDEYYDVSIPATGHNYVLNSEDSESPTCTANGYWLYECRNGECDSYYTTARPALGHHYVVSVLKAATSSKEGTWRYACSREDCGACQNKQTIFPYKKISLSKSKYKYTGSPIVPSFSVKDIRGATIPPQWYSVVCYSNKNVGTATLHITFSGKYKGTLKTTFKITKGSNSISVPSTSYTLKKSDLKKSAISINLGASAKSGLSYKESSSHLSVSKGVVKVKKGTPKGTYTVTIKAKETKNVKSATKKVKIYVK